MCDDQQLISCSLNTFIFICAQFHCSIVCTSVVNSYLKASTKDIVIDVLEEVLIYVAIAGREIALLHVRFEEKCCTILLYTKCNDGVMVVRSHDNTEMSNTVLP